MLPLLPALVLSLGAAQASRTPGASTEADARTACSTCHLFPPADILPRVAWRDEIARMALIRDNQPEPAGPPGTAARLVQLPPDFARALRYYMQEAPESLPPPAPWPPVDASGFVRRSMAPKDARSEPAVSNVRLLDVDGDGTPELMATEMRYGLVLKGRPAGAHPTLDVIAQLKNPCHISMTDLDKDGIPDFLVADLGEFRPGDQAHGAVVVLHGARDGTYHATSLDGWPRVADVEAADFDGDGTLDLAVAAFGWRKVGSLSILANHGGPIGQSSFVAHVIDPRPGAIHAVPADLNHDGKPDLVVLFAQQFETVVAFLNDGGPQGGFTPQTIYTGPHPNWGSSGIQVIDLDGDGDLDVLLTHGDTFDDQIVKPYHGNQWLENTGTFPFVAHTLATLPGVSRAEAVDLDGDGDLDVVASVFIASSIARDLPDLPSLVWLEQTRRGVFVQHTLERGLPWHATLDVGDIDRDGDSDIVVGNFVFADRPAGSWVDVWENTGRVVRSR